MGLPRSTSAAAAAATTPQSPRRSRTRDRCRSSPFLSRSAERLRRCALRLHAYLRPAATEPRPGPKVMGRRNAAASSPRPKLTPKRLCARAEGVNWRSLVREVPVQLPNGVTFVHKGGVQSTRF